MVRSWGAEFWGFHVLGTMPKTSRINTIISLQGKSRNTHTLDSHLQWVEGWILHIQSRSPLIRMKDNDIRDLFYSIDLGTVILAWKYRPHLKDMIELMMIRDNTLYRYFKRNAFNRLWYLYTRLFGHGEHNLINWWSELMDIDKIRHDKNPEKAYLTFHGARMYKDAARLKVYQKSENSPMLQKVKDWNH